MRLPHVTLPSLILSLTLILPFVSAQPRPANLVAPPSSASGALSALKYTKVGGTGTYEAVTDIKPGTFPSCDVNPFCVTESRTVSGASIPSHLNSIPRLYSHMPPYCHWHTFAKR